MPKKRLQHPRLHWIWLQPSSEKLYMLLGAPHGYKEMHLPNLSTMQNFSYILIMDHIGNKKIPKFWIWGKWLEIKSPVAQTMMQNSPGVLRKHYLPLYINSSYNKKQKQSHPGNKRSLSSAPVDSIVTCERQTWSDWWQPHQLNPIKSSAWL